MGKLKVLSGSQLVKLFMKIGFEVDHQTGSHMILRNFEYPNRRLTVPNHKSIAKGTLRSLIKQAGLSLDEFNAL